MSPGLSTPTPRDVKPAVIGTLRPPLNIDHAVDPNRELVLAARQTYYASAPIAAE